MFFYVSVYSQFAAVQSWRMPVPVEDTQTSVGATDVKSAPFLTKSAVFSLHLNILQYFFQNI